MGSIITMRAYFSTMYLSFIKVVYEYDSLSCFFVCLCIIQYKNKFCDTCHVKKLLFIIIIILDPGQKKVDIIIYTIY